MSDDRRCGFCRKPIGAQERTTIVHRYEPEPVHRECLALEQLGRAALAGTVTSERRRR